MSRNKLWAEINKPNTHNESMKQCWISEKNQLRLAVNPSTT